MKYKTRLTKGTSGQVFHRLYSKGEREAFTWALNLKPGDIFNSYDSWNHEVERIEVKWRNVSYLGRMNKETNGRRLTPNGRFIRDITIYSKDGMMHSITEAGCIVPAYSVEQLKRFGKNYLDAAIKIGYSDSRGVIINKRLSDEQSRILLLAWQEDRKIEHSDELFISAKYPKLNTYKK